MRKENWDVILDKYLESMKDKEFEWSELDCCTFAGNFVQKITGIDPIPEFRNHYTTALGAKKALEQATCISLVACPVTPSTSRGQGSKVTFAVPQFP